MSRQNAPKPEPAEENTSDLLVSAASREFNALGYHGTNTNRIAKAAGFAPQTFYRHFEDKIDVFLAVYDAWQSEERAAITKAARSAAPHRAIARAVLDHHRRWTIFRRSLRLIALEDPKVRAARTASRNRQLDILAGLAGNTTRSRAGIARDLLAVERLCDAAAEGELDDLGFTPREVLLAAIAAIASLRGES